MVGPAPVEVIKHDQPADRSNCFSESVRPARRSVPAEVRQFLPRGRGAQATCFVAGRGSSAAARSAGCTATCSRARRAAGPQPRAGVVQQAAALGLTIRPSSSVPVGSLPGRGAPPPARLPSSRRTSTTPGRPVARPRPATGCPAARCCACRCRPRAARPGRRPRRGGFVRATEPDIGAAACHLRRDRDGVSRRPRRYRGLLGVVLRVQHHGRNPRRAACRAVLRFGHVVRPHQHRRPVAFISEMWSMIASVLAAAVMYTRSTSSRGCSACSARSVRHPANRTGATVHRRPARCRSCRTPSGSG